MRRSGTSGELGYTTTHPIAGALIVSVGTSPARSGGAFVDSLDNPPGSRPFLTLRGCSVEIAGP